MEFPEGMPQPDVSGITRQPTETDLLRTVQLLEYTAGLAEAPDTEPETVRELLDSYRVTAQFLKAFAPMIRFLPGGSV